MCDNTVQLIESNLGVLFEIYDSRLPVLSEVNFSNIIVFNSLFYSMQMVKIRDSNV